MLAKSPLHSAPNRRSLTILSYAASLVLLFAWAAHASAQTGTMAPDARPYTATEGGDLDSISTVNGGLQLHIPLWSIQQRGNLSLSFTLRYNSPSYSVNQNCNVPNQPCTYSYGGYVQGVFVSASTDVNVWPIQKTIPCGNGTCVGAYYWQVTTPDSGTHNMVS